MIRTKPGSSWPDEIDKFVNMLDVADRDQLAELLERHLLAAADRAGAPRRDAHLYSLEIRDVDSQGSAYGKPLFQWALPMDPDYRYR
ncbi:hypothetical protein GCM10009765_32570 [Fodinicola feengrottensis]|uniref:Uncharacterized protein n=1 Tax=Fodinicola feengrottensis TaxID=435914 RepID=A0ABN2H2K7_9ACTN